MPFFTRHYEILSTYGTHSVFIHVCQQGTLFNQFLYGQWKLMSYIGHTILPIKYHIWRVGALFLFSFPVRF